MPDSELRRAKDHLKGSLMLSLESTSSRMSHLARQEIYFDRQFGLDETLEGVERVTTDDVQRVARICSADGSLAATVLGAVNGLQIPRERGFGSCRFVGCRRPPPSAGLCCDRDDPALSHTLKWVASGATSGDTRPGCRSKSPPPRPWRGPGSFRRMPRATSASAAPSTSPASRQIEEVTQHDVIAFTTALAEHVGPSARWLHFGLTSSDVIDTAQALQMREACDLILAISTR